MSQVLDACWVPPTLDWVIGDGRPAPGNLAEVEKQVLAGLLSLLCCSLVEHTNVEARQLRWWGWLSRSTSC